MLYSQREYADCLVNAAENFLGISRDAMPQISYYNTTPPVATYFWFYKTLKERGEFVVSTNYTHHWDFKIKAICGFKLRNYNLCHAMYFDGNKYFCGQKNKFFSHDEIIFNFECMPYSILPKNLCWAFKTFPIEHWRDADDYNFIIHGLSKTFKGTYL